MTFEVTIEMRKYMHEMPEVGGDTPTCIIESETPAKMLREFRAIDAEYLEAMGEHIFTFLETRP